LTGKSSCCKLPGLLNVIPKDAKIGGESKSRRWGGKVPKVTLWEGNWFFSGMVESESQKTRQHQHQVKGPLDLNRRMAKEKSLGGGRRVAKTESMAGELH